MEAIQLKQVEEKIITVRDRQVILDSDVAELYGVETREVNQAIKNNTDKFPDGYILQLDKDEWENLKSQFVISSWGGTRKLPFAFTEQGLAMLSGVLNSDIAIDVNISIMRAFVALRQYASGYAELNRKLEEFMIETNLQFSDIYQALAELATIQKETIAKPRRRIGFAFGDNTPDNENR
jgi:hypothetical protein